MMVLTLAWRNIWRNPVRSLVIIISVSLGLIAGVFVLGLYDGVLHSRLRTVIDTEVAHLQVHHPKFKNDFEAIFTLPNPEALINEWSALPQVKTITARSLTNGMLATTTGSAGVQIIGVNPFSENKVSQLENKIIEGEGFFANRKNQILIGKKLADKMKIKLASKVVITFTDKENTIVSAAFRVAGVYQSENTPLDERNVYVQFNELSRLLGLENECHEIAILLKDDASLDGTKSLLQTRYPQWLIETWKEISPETRLMIETTDTYTIIFVIIIMLALMFGIINTMLMAVLERTREIGMLVALGVNKVRLFLLVLWETILLTLAGAPLGFLLSWGIVQYYHRNGIDISSFAGKAMSGFGFSSLIYPEFPWTKLLLVFYIVTATALLASIFPSYKALQLEPVEAMRQ